MLSYEQVGRMFLEIVSGSFIISKWKAVVFFSIPNVQLVQSLQENRSNRAEYDGSEWWEFKTIPKEPRWGGHAFSCDLGIGATG